MVGPMFLAAATATAVAAAAPEPKIGFVVLPLPLAAMGAGVLADDLAIGATRHEARLLGLYIWRRNFYYDPLVPAPTELDTRDGRHVPANTWELRGAWGWKLAPWATLYADGYGVLGGPASTGSYDDPLANGYSASGGPLLQLAQVDHLGFPTTGWLARGGYAWGYHGGAASFGFQRGSLEVARFVPLGPGATVALRVAGQAAWPQLAWIDKFSAGGAMPVRGFQWNRFTGDRFLAGTCEYRRVVEPDLLGRLGFPLPGVSLGVASATYVDVGRAWEGRAGLGVPFPQDVRIGAGTGLVGLVNGVAAGRVELNVSPEGVFPVAGAGASF